MARPEPHPQTVDRLRADIDSGLTGDKVPGSDPAAAPLGTDAEAGGAPPTRAEIDLEARSRPRMDPAPEGSKRSAWIWGAGVVLVLLLVVGVFAAG